MKNILMFSIGQLLKLVALLKPLIELVVDIVKIIKDNDKEERGKRRVITKTSKLIIKN